MGARCTLGWLLAPTPGLPRVPTQVRAATDPLLSNSGRRAAPSASPHPPRLSHPAQGGRGQSGFGGQRQVLDHPWLQEALRFGEGGKGVSAFGGGQEKRPRQTWGLSKVFICPLSHDPLYFPWGLRLSLSIPPRWVTRRLSASAAPDWRDGAGSGWKRPEVMAQVRLTPERTGFRGKPPMCSNHPPPPHQHNALGGSCRPSECGAGGRDSSPPGNVVQPTEVAGDEIRGLGFASPGRPHPSRPPHAHLPRPSPRAGLGPSLWSSVRVRLLKCTGPEPAGEIAWLSQARGRLSSYPGGTCFEGKCLFSGRGEGAAFEAVGGVGERERRPPLFLPPFAQAPVPGLLLHTSRESKKKAPRPGREGAGGGPDLFWKRN